MIKMFHLSLSLGRTDTITVEAKSKESLLTFFTSVSEAVVRNIKQIVYSKDYNINYIKQNYVPQETYHKVEVVALTQNYCQTFTLFHIKKSVTKEIIMREYKKLLINNEPIVDFVSIVFYNEGDSPLNIQNLYQVQYKRNSKTYTENIYASSWQIAREVVESLKDGEITEIREYLHHSDKVKKDSGDNYYKAVNCYLQKDGVYRALKIPKVKHSITHDNLLTQVSQTFTNHSQAVTKEEINLKYS